MITYFCSLSGGQRCRPVRSANVLLLPALAYKPHHKERSINDLTVTDNTDNSHRSHKYRVISKKWATQHWNQQEINNLHSFIPFHCKIITTESHWDLSVAQKKHHYRHFQLLPIFCYMSLYQNLVQHEQALLFLPEERTIVWSCLEWCYSCIALFLHASQLACSMRLTDSLALSWMMLLLHSAFPPR
jgi:hypothetical protein